MFHYFFPSVVSKNGVVDPAVFASRFLADSIGKLKPKDYGAYEMTIDGVVGTFLTPYISGGERASQTLSYNSREQTWIKIDEMKHPVWIGWDNENPPTPATLRRAAMVAGRDIADQHDRTWVIPIARAGVPGAETIPADIDYDFTGETPVQITRPSKRFATLLEMAETIYDGWNGDELTFFDTDALNLSAAILSVNYLIGPIECRAFLEMGLPILDSTTAHRICLSLIDWQISDEVKKKLTPQAAA